MAHSRSACFLVLLRSKHVSPVCCILSQLSPSPPNVSASPCAHDEARRNDTEEYSCGPWDVCLAGEYTMVAENREEYAEEAFACPQQ
eukprot:717284-Hanusia_phi.AAC.1